MSSVFARVLDSSALLAFLHSEPGGDVVEPLLRGAAISAVNWSEVLRQLYHRRVDTSGLMEDLTALQVDIVPFDASQADTAARLWAVTNIKGLSLGDRACLALALRNGVPAITADRVWNNLDVGVTIQLIR